MAVTNRGSILISTANDIGSSLVDVIGGEGYTPNEWAKEINLCGIAASDIPTALENIEENTPSGTDRGSISLDTANAVGAVLNKKYNTARGFKPSEWASAISFLEPLPEKNVSSAPICELNDGADDVPTKSLVVTIPPSLSGIDEVDVYKCGVNLFDKTKATIGKYINVNGQEATNSIKAHSALLPLKPSTTYYMSGHADASYYSILALDKDMNVLSTWYSGASKTEAFIATTPSNARWCYLNFNADQIDTVIFAESATAIPYEPYDGTTYTASLGRTVYGESADIVKGEGTETWKKFVGTDLQTIGISSTTSEVIVFQAYFSINGLPNGINGSIISNNFDTAIPSGHAHRMVLSSNILYFVIAKSDLISEDIAGCKQWFIDNPTSFVYELATPTDFTFTGQEINTKLGYNAFWSDEGDSSVVYRADIDSPEPSNLLGLSNSNNNNEEESNI